MSTETVKPVPVVRTKSTKEIYAYTDLINDIAAETSVPKSHVRKVLETAQERVANFCRSHQDGRVRFGRLGVFNSRMTKDRMVNNPQSPGNQIPSYAHLVLRFDPGTSTKAFMTDGREGWFDRAPKEEVQSK